VIKASRRLPLGQDARHGVPHTAFAGSLGHGQVRSAGNGPKPAQTRAYRWCPGWFPDPIDVDRSRKVASGRIVRNPAPMLVLRTLMLKMMVNFREAASGALKINSLEGALRIEWE